MCPAYSQRLGNCGEVVVNKTIEQLDDDRQIPLYTKRVSQDSQDRLWVLADSHVGWDKIHGDDIHRYSILI